MLVQKLIIDVSVTQPPGDALSAFRASDHFLVPSPAVYWAPVALTNAELLAQASERRTMDVAASQSD